MDSRANGSVSPAVRQLRFESAISSFRAPKLHRLGKASLVVEDTPLRKSRLDAACSEGPLRDSKRLPGCVVLDLVGNRSLPLVPPIHPSRNVDRPVRALPGTPAILCIYPRFRQSVDVRPVVGTPSCAL